jgi:cytochrome c biogenesis protein CcdA
MTSPAGWLARAQRLGSAYLAVVQAELQAVLRDLGESGRGVLRAAVLFTVTVALGFWTVGLLVYFLVEMLALWLPRWGAVGVVFAVFVAGTLAFAAACVARGRRIESPSAIVERRWRDHSSWWQEQIAGEAAIRGRVAAEAEDEGVDE